MNTLLIILIGLVALLLILTVLLQEPKEGGISAGLSSVSQYGGVQKTTHFLEKTTWVLFILLITLSVLKVGLDKRSKSQFSPSQELVPLEESLGS